MCRTERKSEPRAAGGAAWEEPVCKFKPVSIEVGIGSREPGGSQMDPV